MDKLTLPPAALEAFRDEQARIVGIRALMEAISQTDADMQRGLHLQIARVTMVGQILEVQRSTLAYGKIEDWFDTNFGADKKSTLRRWAAVGQAVRQACPELAMRAGQMLLNSGHTNADDLATMGEEIASTTGIDSLNRLYKWAATVRNPPQQRRTRPPAEMTPDQKKRRELADITAHLADLKEVLHVLCTPKVRASLGLLAEENRPAFTNLRRDLLEQMEQFGKGLNAIKVK